MKFAEWITNAENEYAWTHDGDAIIFPAATEALDKLVNNPPEVADDPVFKAAYEEAAKAAKEAEAWPRPPTHSSPSAGPPTHDPAHP
jgi:hypothetical protein